MFLAPYILIALALIGLGDTLYLSYFQYHNLLPSCALGGCEVVLTHEFSKFFGVPWSYVGLVYYTYLLGLSILLALDLRSFALRLGMLVYAGIGLAYSIWAIFYVQLSIIGAVCEYCTISAILTASAFVVALWHWRTRPVLP